MFLGCTVPVRNLNYELSARKVAEALGVGLKDMPDLGCCGFPLKSLNQPDALAIAGRALAIAGETGLPVVTLCSACAGFLAESAHVLDHDPDARSRVNQRLADLGLAYRGGVKVRHFVRFILEEVGLDEIRRKIVRPLAGFTFAPHYGCHYLKPSTVHGKFDEPYNPTSLSGLIEATGASSLDYPTLRECCGGGVLGADEDLAGRMAGAKLADLSQRDISAMVLICPFCNVMYEGQQKSIAKKLELDRKVPVVYLTQILGLALGFTPDDLGFRLNRMKPKELIKALSQGRDA